MRKVLSAQIVALVLIFHAPVGFAQGLMTLGAGSVSRTAAAAALACSYTPVTTGTEGAAYTGATPSPSGGTSPYTFSETGTLPTGLSINTSTGVISGTPSVSGSFASIQVSVTDSASHTANCGASFTLVISPSSGFSLTFATDGTSTAKTTTISYGTQTWGTCSAVVIGIGWFNTNSTDVISSVSVGGVAATQVSGAKTASSNGNVTSDIWELPSPGGTSGTVSVTFSVAPSFSSAIAAYCLVTTHTTASDGSENFTSPPVAATIAVPSGGGAIAVAGSQNGSAITFTNATLDAAPTPSGALFAFAHTTTTGSVNVSTTSTAAVISLSLAAWGP